MLADEGERVPQAGLLDPQLHLPGEWLITLISFIARLLPAWRDDPKRPRVASETKLTDQLCAKLNSSCRLGRLDFLQFRQEAPDEISAGRAIDLVASPRGTIIWLAGRKYSDYQTLLPIECKRLPTPPGAKRDEREYLHNRHSSTGGVHRFKSGHHGAGHSRAAMIGYLQDRDADHWRVRLESWVGELTKEAVVGWSAADKLELVDHDSRARLASLRSQHKRESGMEPIAIHHLWIEM